MSFIFTLTHPPHTYTHTHTHSSYGNWGAGCSNLCWRSWPSWQAWSSQGDSIWTRVSPAYAFHPPRSPWHHPQRKPDLWCHRGEAKRNSDLLRADLQWSMRNKDLSLSKTSTSFSKVMLTISTVYSMVYLTAWGDNCYGCVYIIIV